MQHGDIDNTVPPLLVITLDVLAPLPNGEVPKATLAERMKRWNRAVEYRRLDRHCVGMVWKLGSRTGVRFDLLVLGKSEPYVEAVREWVDRENLPVRHVVGSTSAQAFARELAYRPDVVGVIDVPGRGLAYGSHYISDIRGVA